MTRADNTYKTYVKDNTLGIVIKKLYIKRIYKNDNHLYTCKSSYSVYNTHLEHFLKIHRPHIYLSKALRLRL